MIRCSECGRAISDRAAHCVGCGAPTTKLSGIDWLPQRTIRPPPNPRQLRLHGSLAALMLLGGTWWATALEHRAGTDRMEATLAALLLITGLCWLIVTLLQGVALRAK